MASSVNVAADSALIINDSKYEEIKRGLDVLSVEESL